MKLVRYVDPARGSTWGLVEGETVHPLGAGFGEVLASGLGSRDALLSQAEGDSFPLAELARGLDGAGASRRTLAAPVANQEVWAAGVTYLRSKVARMEESEGAARFYDMVYDADRPELFLKATPRRVVGPGGEVRIRRDARWNVPEPELALVLDSRMRIIGYTVGNDMSSRDIEGENPLYLPQAKVYSQSCALGPVILLEEDPDREHREFAITLEIRRSGELAYSGQTSTGQMKRTFADLARWLGKDNDFPDGAILLTGTGLVPGDDFTLEPGDEVAITVPEIGALRNRVVRAGE